MSTKTETQYQHLEPRRLVVPLLLDERPIPGHIIEGLKDCLQRALKALGKTVEFDIYPRSSHLYYEPMLEREAMKRNLEWFQRWIKPAS